MSDASLKLPPSRGVSLTTLILTAALTATTTAAVVMAVLYFTAGGRPTAAGSPGQPSAFAGSSPAPSVQKDTVKPLGLLTGEVFYEVPYASPPHLTLSAPHHVYRIVKQDEFGFSWAAEAAVEDFIEVVVDAAKGEKVKQPKDKVDYEDFTYEAKGIPAEPGVVYQRPYEQTGSFRTVIGTQGQENFANPYVSPPQITLKGTNDTTVIVEATNTGFTWKNGGTDAFRDNGPVDWTAQGIRATKLPK